MEVKRVPQSSVGQAVDPSSQPSHQEHKQGDKGKKKEEKKAESGGTPEAAASPTEAPWEDAELSRQPIDSEKVVEMLNPPQPSASQKPPYPAKRGPMSRESKLNRKY